MSLETPEGLLPEKRPARPVVVNGVPGEGWLPLGPRLKGRKRQLGRGQGLAVGAAGPSKGSTFSCLLLLLKSPPFRFAAAAAAAILPFFRERAQAGKHP